MIPNALIITGIAVNAPKFLALATQAIGYSPALLVDQAPVVLSETAKFLSYLAAMQTKTAAPGLAGHLLSHASSSVMIAADAEDMQLILQAAEMPYVLVDTVVRGTQLAVVTGSLQEWAGAVVRGTACVWDANVRSCFTRILEAFVASGMDLWKGTVKERQQDGTLKLGYSK